MLAARRLVAQAAAEHEGMSGFLDPTLNAAGGVSERATGIPGVSLGADLAADAVTFHFGVEKPLRPGVYAGAGVAERYLTDPDSGTSAYDQLYQTTAGAGLRIPLLRDRLFAEWRHDERRARESAEATRYRLLAVTQDVRREVEAAYIDALSVAADAEEIRQSVTRVRELLAEAQELVRLQLVPEYQLFPARLEVALREEEAEAAEHERRAALIRLGTLTGSDGPAAVAAPPGALMEWAASSLTNQPLLSLEQACRARGVFMELQHRVLAADENCRLACETLKPDISLRLSAIWQAEDPDRPIGRDALLAEREWGTEAAVVWVQALGRTRERAAARARREELEALREEQRAVRLRIAAELNAARSALDAARKRLALLGAAVENGRRTLQAEKERFRLGEGRSRNVLDAQNDLTAAVRRHNAAAAALMHAWADLHYAQGYGAAATQAGDEDGRE